MRGKHFARRRIALRRLVVGIAASSLGDGLVAVAFPLLAVHLTTRPLLIAGVSIAASLPWLLISLPAGAFADRVDRQRIVFIVDLARAALIGAFALVVATHHASITLLLAATFLVGAGETVIAAATRAVVPLLAEGEGLIRANGRINAVGTAGTDFAGPALGGVLYSVAASIPFFGDAISYVLSSLLFRTAMPAGKKVQPSDDTTLAGDIRIGLGYFLRNRPLRILAAVVSGFAFCQAMVGSVIVLYATRVLHLDEVGFGLFLSVAAVGNIASSLLAVRVRSAVGPIATVLIAGMTASAGYLLLAGSANIALAVTALTVEATATGVGNVATFSLQQALIPIDRFGLIHNAFLLCILGVVPLGGLLSGLLTTDYGTRTAFWIAGTVQLIILAIFALPLRSAAPQEPMGSHSRLNANLESDRSNGESDSLKSADLTQPPDDY